MEPFEQKTSHRFFFQVEPHASADLLPPIPNEDMLSLSFKDYAATSLVCIVLQIWFAEMSRFL